MAAGVARDENDEIRASIGGGWVYNRSAQEAQKEILVYCEGRTMGRLRIAA